MPNFDGRWIELGESVQACLSPGYRFNADKEEEWRAFSAAVMAAAVQQHLRALSVEELLNYDNEGWDDADWAAELGDELARRAKVAGLSRGEYVRQALTESEDTKKSVLEKVIT